MALTIDQQNLPDPPTFQEFQLQADILGGYFQIFDNNAEIILIYGAQGQYQRLPNQILPPGSYNVARPPNGAPLSGIRARSAVAGVTAVFAGYFYTVADPTVAFVGSVGASGAGVNSVRVRRTSNQGIATGTNIISFQAETFDNGDMWVIGQPTRLTVPAGGAGKYLVGGHAIFDASNSGEFHPFVRLNGTTIIGVGSSNAQAVGASGFPTMVTVVTLWDANDGDYFEIGIEKTDVGRNLVAAAEYSGVGWATRLP